MKSPPIILLSETPADLKATNSERSPNPPSVILDASRTANGKAIGKTTKEYKPISFKINENSFPLPTISSIYLKRNIIRKIKSPIKKVRTSGPMNKESNILSTLFKQSSV